MCENSESINPKAKDSFVQKASSLEDISQQKEATTSGSPLAEIGPTPPLSTGAKPTSFVGSTESTDGSTVNNSTARSFIKKFESNFKASSWNGYSWLIFLCVQLVIIGGIYVFVHINNKNQGREYVQLEKDQLKIVKKILDDSETAVGRSASGSGKAGNGSGPSGIERVTTSSGSGATDSGRSATDSGGPTSSSPNTKQEKGSTTATDTINRINRTVLIMQYLNDEYNNGLIKEKELDTILNKMNNSVLYDYLSDKKILVSSPFWLTGGDVYLEAFWWSVLGVLVSLIFYVSTANSNTLKSDGNDVAGPFQTSEIPSQVAKMFYAPAVTIIIVLGYHFLSDKNNNLADLSVNKGLIVFSFIAGFYSGRLMKFLDRLKDLLLPFDGTPATAATNADVNIKLNLSDSLSADPNTAKIKDSFKSASVTLIPLLGGKTIDVSASTDIKSNIIFIAKQTPIGKYQAKAKLTFTNSTGTVINLVGETPIEVTGSKNDFDVTLNNPG